MSTRPTKQRAHWTTEDEKALLTYLIEHKAEHESTYGLFIDGIVAMKFLKFLHFFWSRKVKNWVS